MAFSNARTTSFSVAQIVKRAAQLAGIGQAGQDLSQDQIEQGTDFLVMELDQIQAEKTVLRSVSIDTLSFPASTASVTLDASTLDILEDAMWSYSGKTHKTPVIFKRREDWLRITGVTQTGLPVFAYLERDAEPTVTLYPTPDAAGSLHIQRVTWLRDPTTNEVNVDMVQYWVAAITYAVAAHMAMANNRDVNVVGYLQGQANVRKQACRQSEQQHGPSQWKPAYRR